MQGDAGLFTKCLKHTRPKLSLCRLSLMASRLCCFFPASSISSLSHFHFYVIYIRFLKLSNKSIILKILGGFCNPQVLKDIQRLESHPSCEGLFHLTLQETKFESSSWHYILVPSDSYSLLMASFAPLSKQKSPQMN